MVIKKNTDSKKSEYTINKNNAKMILDFINKNKKCKINNSAGIVIENGKKKSKPSFMIPRSLLKLNTFNHRFTTSMNTLRDERIKSGKSPEFDMNKKADVEIIRNMLRGIDPSNKDRHNQYNILKNEIEKASFEFGTNGIEKPTIITADGIYINGNRRDTVLEDLKQIQIKKKKGGLPEKYNSIGVMICDADITNSDIRRMELKEQVSKDLRDEYDTMNSAILVKEEYENELAIKGPGHEEEVKKILAGTMEGRNVKKINELLDFADFVDQVLIQLKLERQYHKINTNSDENDAVPVTTIIKQFSSKWANASPADKANIIFECAGTVQGVLSKSKITDPTHYNFTSRKYWESRTLRNKSPSAKKIVDDYDWSSHDFTSIESCKRFGNILQKAEERAKDEEWINSPSKLLVSVNDKLVIISDALTGPQNKRMKIKLKQSNVDRHLREIKKSLASIESKLKKIKT